MFKAESKQCSLGKPRNLTKPRFFNSENSNRDPQSEYPDSRLVPDPNPGHLTERQGLHPWGSKASSLGLQRPHHHCPTPHLSISCHRVSQERELCL